MTSSAGPRQAYVFHRLQQPLDYIGWLADNGTGKSYTINALLNLFEASSYNPKPVECVHANAVRIDQLATAGAADAAGADVWMVSDEDAEFYESERKKEDRVMAEILQGGKAPDIRKFGGLPAFLLPSADPNFHDSTTTYVTEIKGGDRYMLKVTYMTEKEIKDLLLTHNFALGDWAHDDQHSRMVEFMKHLVEPSIRVRQAEKEATQRVAEEIASLSDHQRQSMERNELDAYVPLGDYISEEAYYREFHEQVTLLPGARRVAGKTVYFVGHGQDITQDRMFIRRALYNVKLVGLFRGMGHAKNTEWNPTSSGYNGFSYADPDVYMISKIEVTVPNELLGTSTALLDMPGSNDCNAVKTHQLHLGLERSNSLIVLSQRTSELSVQTILADQVFGPYSADLATRWNRIGHFLYQRDNNYLNVKDREGRDVHRESWAMKKELLKRHVKPGTEPTFTAITNLSGYVVEVNAYLFSMFRNTPETEMDCHGFRQLIQTLLEAQATSAKMFKKAFEAPPQPPPPPPAAHPELPVTSSAHFERVWKKWMERVPKDPRMTVEDLAVMACCQRHLRNLFNPVAWLDQSVIADKLTNAQRRAPPEISDLVFDLSALLLRLRPRFYAECVRRWTALVGYHTMDLSKLELQAETLRLKQCQADFLQQFDANAFVEAEIEAYVQEQLADVPTAPVAAVPPSAVVLTRDWKAMEQWVREKWFGGEGHNKKRVRLTT